MSTNPYQAPTAGTNLEVDHSVIDRDSLAPRVNRFAAAMIDGILIAMIALPIQFLSGFFARAMTQQVGFVEVIAMTLIQVGIYLAINGYLLINRGQTVGKMILSIQIVDFESNKLIPFVRVYVIRYLWILPFSILTALIPGQLDEFLVGVLTLVDMLFIFGAAQRCVHDYLAGSKVVVYHPNRPHM